jgi:protein phosphatase
MSNLTLRFCARSDIGRVRKNNEDSGYASRDLLVVADGMGGHAAGELASAATVAAIVGGVNDALVTQDVLTQLAEAVIVSGEHIADIVSADNSRAGMGTTLTALALREERIAIAHVGDSRAYLFRDGNLQQLTKDHTFVQSLVDAGEITREEAAVHPRRNLMMRAIDGIHAVDVDLSVREAHVGERYLLCSDGLCGVVPEDVIAECLEQADLTNAVSALIEMALSYGAPDNITVVAADVTEDDFAGEPVIVGAAGESGNRKKLPGVAFPDDAISLPQLQAPGGRRRSRLTIVLTAVATTAALFAGLLFWLSSQWYIGRAGTTGTYYLGLFQGIPVANLNHLVEFVSVEVDSLPDFERTQVIATIPVADRATGHTTLEALQELSNVCNELPTTPGCPAATQ